MSAIEETKESLVAEYCKAIKDRGGSYEAWKNTTASRVTYLKVRIPMLLETTDDYIWAAAQYKKVHLTNTIAYSEFLTYAVNNFTSKRQLNRLLKLVAKSNPLRKILHLRGIELMLTRDEVVEYIKKHLLD